MTPLGPARLDVAYNPYKLQPGPLFQVDTLGNLPRCPDNYVKNGSGSSPSTSRSDRRSDAAGGSRGSVFVYPARDPGDGARRTHVHDPDPAGRNLLARTVSRALDRVVIGQVKVGAISGSFLYDLTLEDLVVRDTSGALLADLPRVRVTYRLPNLLAKQVCSAA